MKKYRSTNLGKCAINSLFTGFFLLIFLQCGFDKTNESEAVRFDRFARETFKEIYPAIAEQILKDYNIRHGTCLDIGCGAGYLSIEIAKRSKLNIIGVDIDPEAIRIAKKNIKKEKLSGQITVEQGDVHKLHFTDDSVDLIVSRGSFIFWDHTAKAFKEIHRILKPGGVAFIGGGFGRSISPEKRAFINRKVDQAGFRDCGKIFTPIIMQEILESINIQEYKIIKDSPQGRGCRCGMWVEMRKTNSFASKDFQSEKK
ncbi:class I SAM-dependent methyltransferase [candidate division KSB1 bacterium]|nr:class I SAM-dependent methyltransferase [candidate division KSB1 bacterium]